jgi:hypothetical protein
MRLLVFYLRSQQAPLGLATALGSVAALWWADQATDQQVNLLSLLAVVVATLAASPGLAGQDLNLDRTGAIDCTPRRAAHLLAIGTVATGLVAAAGLTGEQVAAAGKVARDASGMVGRSGAPGPGSFRSPGRC